jgi:hypothetical protein
VKYTKDTGGGFALRASSELAQLIRGNPLKAVIEEPAVKRVKTFTSTRRRNSATIIPTMIR